MDVITVQFHITVRQFDITITEWILHIVSQLEISIRLINITDGIRITEEGYHRLYYG